MHEYPDTDGRRVPQYPLHQWLIDTIARSLIMNLEIAVDEYRYSVVFPEDCFRFAMDLSIESEHRDSVSICGYMWALDVYRAFIGGEEVFVYEPPDVGWEG